MATPPPRLLTTQPPAVLLKVIRVLRPVPGLGDMAVSNTIGSNVFDILVGLGVPWALQTMCVDYGSEVRGAGRIYLHF